MLLCLLQTSFPSIQFKVSSKYISNVIALPLGKLLLELISRTEAMIRESQFPFNCEFYLVSNGKIFLFLSCNIALVFCLYYQDRKHGLDRYLITHLL